MRLPWPRRPALNVVPDGLIAAIMPATPFLLAPGHPMRRAPCIECGQPVGGELAVATGLILFGGNACRCGSVPAEMFLAHAAHGIIQLGRLKDQARGRIEDTHDHDWMVVR